MTKKDLERLKPGDKVRIISEKSNTRGWNVEGEMDKWLGKTVTVKTIIPTTIKNKVMVKIVEDEKENCGHGWFWAPEMIACIVDDDGNSGVVLSYLVYLKALGYKYITKDPLKSGFTFPIAHETEPTKNKRAGWVSDHWKFVDAEIRDVLNLNCRKAYTIEELINKYKE